MCGIAIFFCFVLEGRERSRTSCTAGKQQRKFGRSEGLLLANVKMFELLRTASILTWTEANEFKEERNSLKHKVFT